MRPFKSRFQCPSCNWPVLTEDCYTCISCGSISNPFLCNSTCPVCHHAEKSIICGRCRGSFPIDEWHEKSKWGEIGQIYDQLTSLSSLLKEKNLRTYDKMLQSYFKQMPDLKRKIDSARQAIARFNKAEIVEEITQTTARLEDTHANGATTVLQEKLKILKSTFERIQKLAETLEIYQLKQESFVAELKNLELRIIQDDLVTEEEIISLSKTIEDINNVFDVMDKTKTSYAKFCS